MKNLLIASLALASLSASAAPKDKCKSIALKVAAAVDKVYTPKKATGTTVNASLNPTSDESYFWSVNYTNANAGGQTAYELNLDKEGCGLNQLNVFAE